MHYTTLGKTGMQVSRLCLGTMNLGQHTSEAEAFEILDASLEMGINFIDTADAYGAERGQTENIIGRWLAQGGGRRDAVLLAPKVFGHCGPHYQRYEVNSFNDGLSKYKIIKHCEASLKRLQADHIELYQIHHIDPQCSHEEMWEGMEVLQQQGKVVYVGSCNYAGWNIAECSMVAKNQHKLGLASEQSVYNLSNRALELEVIPACRHFGMGLLPYSPLARGLLSGVLEKLKAGRKLSAPLHAVIDSKQQQLAAFERLCVELGQTPTAIALAWLLHNPVVTAPIIGPRTVQQLRDCASVPGIVLSNATLLQLDQIFPGPGNEAPMAYAW